MERWADIGEAARANLAAAGARNATVVVGDGSNGLRHAAPFDGIIVSAAFPHVPTPLAEQLAEGGRVVHPSGSGGNEDVALFQKKGQDLILLGSITPARFVRLYGEHAFPPG